MEDKWYGFADGYSLYYAPWRNLGREIRINAQMSDGAVFNEDNVTFLEITDDGNLLGTYMKKVVLKVQATDETEEALKNYVDNADFINIEYGVYNADEVEFKNENGEDDFVPANVASMVRIPKMYVSHDETDTEYDEVTKIATFTCYDAMYLLANVPMSSIDVVMAGYHAEDILSKIEEIVDVNDNLRTALKKAYTIGQMSDGSNLGSSQMTALEVFYKGKSIRDYLNNLSNALYCVFYIDTYNEGLEDEEPDCLCMRVPFFHMDRNDDIKVDDIMSISLGKEKEAITGLVYNLKNEQKTEGNKNGNVVYKYKSSDGTKADWINYSVDRHSDERKNLLTVLQNLGQLKNFDITTCGTPWIVPLTCLEYTDMKGNISKLLVNSSVLTISNGITQRIYNQSIDTLFEDPSEKSEDIENLNTANVTVSNSLNPVDDSSSCNIGTSEKRFDTVYCVETNTTSDLKNKENVQSLVDNDKLIDFFKSMKPCSFTMKNGDTGRIHMGFIAQWCAEAAKKTMGDLSFFEASYINGKGECEYFRDDVDDSELSWGLKLNQLIAPLWAVVQIQFDKIENLEKQIEELKNGN